MEQSSKQETDEKDRNICNLENKIEKLQKENNNLTAYLSENDRNICTMEKTIDQLQKKEIELTQSLAKECRNTFELEQKLDSRQANENNLKYELLQKNNLITNHQKRAEILKNQVDQMENQIKKYKDTYIGVPELEPDPLPLDKGEKTSFENLVQYVYANCDCPYPPNMMVKAMDKWIQKILAYEANSEKLIEICKYG